jgi:hypothetical protein
LQIKFDHFHADRCDGAELSQACDPGQHIAYPAL